MPPTLDERKRHQSDVWREFLNHFGLKGETEKQTLRKSDYTPCTPAHRIGMICGTENNPEKRWPVHHWRTLLAYLLEQKDITSIELLGTAKDRTITEQVADGFTDSRLNNLAGKTQLDEFCDTLESLDLLICNDTGGMHLANALGCPIIALFGPTNPVRTGPIFNAPAHILQPPDCPDTGGASLESLNPEQVMKAIEQYSEV